MNAKNIGKVNNMQMSYLGEPMKYRDHDFAERVIALKQLALRARLE